MPLEKAPVGSPGFERNIKTEIAAGKPQKQAVAIAYQKSREDQSMTGGFLAEKEVARRGDTAISAHCSKIDAFVDACLGLESRLDRLESREDSRHISITAIPKGAGIKGKIRRVGK